MAVELRESKNPIAGNIGADGDDSAAARATTEARVNPVLKSVAKNTNSASLALARLHHVHAVHRHVQQGSLSDTLWSAAGFVNAILKGTRILQCATVLLTLLWLMTSFVSIAAFVVTTCLLFEDLQGEVNLRELVIWLLSPYHSTAFGHSFFEGPLPLYI